MTDDDRRMIDRVMELDAAATKGPWTVERPRDIGDNIFAGNRRIADTYGDYEDGGENGANADLIACYRELCPALAALCERQAAQLEHVAAVGIDPLRVELLSLTNKELQQRLEASERIAGRWRDATEEIERLEGQVAGLAADRDRLDWLEENIIYRRFHERYSTYSIEIENSGHSQRQTVRNAIDAAIASVRAGEGAGT